LRLAIISILLSVEEAEFSFLKEKTGATSGNISVQIEKLREANYLTIKKSFKGKYPLTCCAITPKGIAAFEAYVNALKPYLNK